jgi:hypothetical protein
MRTTLGFACLILFVGCDSSTPVATCTPECAPGFTCDNGTCVPAGSGSDGSVGDLPSGCVPACAGATPFCNSSSHCVTCLTDDQCPAGKVCKVISPEVSACVNGCADDARCQAMGGPPSEKCCNMLCADTATDPNNCGGCGMSCVVPHAQATCSGAKCQTGACDTGYADCDADPKNGCEANLHLDDANCTMCGMGCMAAHAITACSDGCYISACDFGFDDCNADISDGCETSVLSDIANCGSCSTPCNGLPNASANCVAGNCVLGKCNNGYFDCNNMPNDGCESNIASDASNCGSCGNVCGNGLVCINGGCTCPKCNFPNANSSCVNQVCVLGMCNQGFGNCDGNDQNGCETYTLGDANNCGQCGNVCPNNMPACVNGACSNFVLFPQAAYDATVTFKDALMSTTMTITYDGSNYWSSSGGSQQGVRFAQYDGNGVMLKTFSPGIDFRSVFTQRGVGQQVYEREYAQANFRPMTAPGVFGNSTPLVGGMIDAQSSLVFNDDGTELIAMSGGTVTRWTAAGALIGTVVLKQFGNMNNENQQPQSRGVAKASGYYLTYASGVLSAWDTMGNRAKTTKLNLAGTGSDSYYGFSYANHLVFIVDQAGGTWRGYNVGL